MRPANARSAAKAPALAAARRAPLSTLALALAAIGIVFGDIGTSPLYTMNTVFEAALWCR